MEQYEEIPIPEIEERMPRKRKPMFLAAGMCAALAAVIVTVIVMVYGKEERALVKSLQNLAKEMEEWQSLWEAAGGKEGFALDTVLNLSAEELPITLGVDTVLRKDDSERKLQATTVFSVMNNKLLELGIYAEDETVMASLPSIWQQNFSFGTKRIDRQYNDSLLAKKWGQIESGEISCTLFPEQDPLFWKAMFSRYKEVVDILSKKKKDEDKALSEITIEKLEGEILIDSVAEHSSRQYRCSQYRVALVEDVVLLIAVDENERIVRVSLEEPLWIEDKKLTGSIFFMGEDRSIDDIVVEMQMELPLDYIPLEERLLSVFGNRIAQEGTEDKIEITLAAEMVYDESDTCVVANLDKLTASVDRIGTFQVKGNMTFAPLQEEIEPLSGETIRLFEMTEEEYKDLERQLLQKLWKWSIFSKLFG